MKYLKNCFFALFLLLVCCFATTPNFAVRNFVTAEESEQKIKYSLLSPLFYANSDDAYEDYNIKPGHILPYQPFDFENSKKMSGMSFSFEELDYHKIDDQYVNLDRVENIENSNNLALSVWIYFSAVYTHDLSLTIELENGSKIEWNLDAEDLYSLVSKSNYDLETPHSWNKLYFPLSKATVSDEIWNGNVLFSPTKLTVRYYSEFENSNISSIYFYDVAIEEIEQTDKYQVERQSYKVFSAYFFDEAKISKLCIGDTLTLPTFQKAIIYAWVGNLDVKADSLKDTTNYKWRVYIISPSGESSEVSFSSKLTLSEAGTYKILYRCFEVQNESTKVIMSPYVEINVNQINAIYFDRSEYKIKIGVKNILNISTSSLFDWVSDIQFEYDEDALDVSLNEKGRVEITAKKTGTYDIKAKISAKRLDGDEKTYDTVLQVEAVKNSQNEKQALKIFIWIASGCFALGIIISIVILVVKSRKIVVK